MIQVKFEEYSVVMHEWRQKGWYSDIQMQKWQEGACELHVEMKQVKKK